MYNADIRRFKTRTDLVIEIHMGKETFGVFWCKSILESVLLKEANFRIFYMSQKWRTRR